MLESTVLHHGRGGGGGDGDVVGISWKTTTKSQSSSPSLVVTCAYQVVVYKPGEHRRIHQWSFKPSAATVLSHPAIYLHSSCRYVGVQQGLTLVSWREYERSVRCPLSTQADGAVQAVHACPRLGDYFVAVLVSGAVALYQGELRRVAYAAENVGKSAKRSMEPRSEPERLARVVWSGVFGGTLAVLAKVGITERLTTFALSLDSSSARGSAAAASVTLISSHVLTKPAWPKEVAVSPAPDTQDGKPSACSAAFLREIGWRPGDGILMVVAWRTPQGPLWTKIVVDARGIREKFARSAVPVSAVETSAIHGAPNGVVTAAVTNGHKKTSGHDRIKSVPTKQMLMAGGLGSGAGMFSSIPAVADADGGRLFVHSGGAYPRLSVWDAVYGILLEDDRAPGTAEFGAECARRNRAASLMVSGEGSYLAIAMAGRVLVCPVPVRDAGTLSSLLRRKRPSSAVEAAIPRGLARAFPAIDLARNASAAGLLDNTGAVEPSTWDAGVVTPFRDAETRAIRLLEGAARRKDSRSFKRIVQEHLQHLRTGVAVISGDDSTDAGGAETGEDGRRKRRRGEGNLTVGAVTTVGVELCLAHPKAALWDALPILLESGGVSARQHGGLVKGVIEHAPHLLEMLMMHVPDLPESDAVRILGYVLSEASVLVSSTPAGNAYVPISSKASGIRGTEEPSPKRAKSQCYGDDGGEDVNDRSPQGKAPSGLGIKESPEKKSVSEVVVVRSEEEAGRKRNIKMKMDDKQMMVLEKINAVGSEANVNETEKGVNGTAVASASNGHVSSTVARDVHGVVEQGEERRGDDREKEKLRERATALVERAVRVAVALPHNEAFLRSALARLSHGEVIVVLKVLTRLLWEELAGGPEGNRATRESKGPAVRTEAVLGWASAVLDSHFTRLAIRGAADPELLDTLKALKMATRREAACCEMLSQVRSLVDEVGRRQAAMTAAVEEGRRDPKRELFSLRVLRF